MQKLVPAPRIVPEFTPVPRKYRYDGWTPERQRAFIEALAELGSVTAAAKRINMSPEGAYYLRRHSEAESFRAAWNAALDHGVQRLTDIAIDRAIEGVSVPLLYKGEQVGEKRWYNDRLLMFLLKHHLPARYAGPLGAGTRHPDTIAREAAENCPVCKARAGEAEQAGDGLTKEQEAWLAEVLKRYGYKVAAERKHRLDGQIVAADFALRQLTHIELILDCGGKGVELIRRWTKEPGKWGPGTSANIHASPLSKILDEIRREAWKAAGDPARPALYLERERIDGSIHGGPTMADRNEARRAAERRIAEAQAEWEAAANEASWEAWKGGRGHPDVLGAADERAAAILGGGAAPDTDRHADDEVAGGNR